MRLRLPGVLRHGLLHAVEFRPGRVRLALFRAGLLLFLMTALAPWKVLRELALAPSAHWPGPRAAARAALWIWNRSWVPVKFPQGTFFDIGWVLSGAAAQALVRRVFVSPDPLCAQCERAQLQLAVIRTAVADDPGDVGAADARLVSLLDDVFAEADRRAKEVRSAGDRSSSERRGPAPPAAVAGADFDNDASRAALLDFDELLGKEGIEYFLVSGTFLGVVRDGAFIGHDHDIDLGVFEDAPLERLREALEASPAFTVIKVDRVLLREPGSDGVRYRWMDHPAIFKIVHRDGVLIDVFVHFHDGDVVWHGAGVHRWDNRRFDLADYPFLGRTLRGAADHERYFLENYGPEWRIPQADFDSNIDTPNIRYSGSANGLVFWAWMVARAVVAGDLPRASRYLEHLEALGVIERIDGRPRVALRTSFAEGPLAA